MTQACPKCNRTLQKSGELVVEGETLAVYQCDECLVPGTMFGEPVELALTFAVGPDGQFREPGPGGFNPD